MISQHLKNTVSAIQAETIAGRLENGGADDEDPVEDEE